MPEQPRTALAICMALAALIGFDVMAIMVRVLSARGYSAPELAAYRNLLGVLPSLIVMAWMGELRDLRRTVVISRWKLALFRGMIVAVAQMCFYTALGLLELATISALAQTNAMFVVLISILMLGERVGLWRIVALVVGFAGVIWILRPGTEVFDPAALLPIVAAFCYGFTIVSVRLFDVGVSNALLYLYSSVASAAGGILLALGTGGFSPIGSLADVGLVLIMAMAGGIAVLLLMFAYRMAAPSLLAPFSYLGILTAFSFGWLIFGEAPVDKLFPGVLLIVAAGGMIIWREQIVQAKPIPPETR
jgi:drug/metabolite transporter (DMT)-like permease